MMFSVNHLCAAYGGRSVLQDVDFCLEAGMLAGILGENGSGKTTMLKAICGIQPHKGNCTLDGQQLEGLSARKMAQLCSYIPQKSGISIDITALDVVLMGLNPWLGLLQQPDRSMHTRAHTALAQVGLAGAASANYQRLSEGQKQLCLFARTLVSDCRLLLLDEPESALDFRVRQKMLALLKAHISDGSRSGLVSLHDPQLALNNCDCILLLHDGRILDVLHPQKDDPAAMAASLSEIYGSISLHRIPDRNGKPHLVMLKEEDV